MRALILEAPGRLRVEEVPIPEPGPGDVLVRVKAATTCGTDLKAYRRGHPLISMPGLFGHEYSGVVAAVGAEAPFEVGDDVMGVHSAPCLNCDWCRRGQENLCQTILATMVMGSYAEYILISARIARLNLFCKPERLSFAHAALLEPLACVAQGIAALNAPKDSRVLVIGPGAIGLMFVAALRQAGVRCVSVAGRNLARLAVGRQFGAEPLSWSDMASSETYDYVIECTGQVDVWERSIDFVRRGGTLMLFGGPPGGSRASFSTSRVHYDQITLVSPFHFGTQAVRQAREWLLDPMFDLSPLISGTRALEDAEEVFRDLEAGHGLKYVFTP